MNFTLLNEGVEKGNRKNDKVTKITKKYSSKGMERLFYLLEKVLSCNSKVMMMVINLKGGSS